MAQDVAEAYEERVFRNFGASSLIRHDQDPRFMSEVFKCFRELLGSRQRATLGYRPQANGQQERSVQTVVRAIKAYISEADQSDWDDHAERLMFALNTSRKLAHMWHGPFRIDEMLDDFRVRLKVEDTGYRVNPWVHVSRLKPRALFPRRPTIELEIPEDDDFDAALLPEDSWEPFAENDEYEVEKILDTRWGKRTRTSKRLREYLVKWKGYDEAEWLPLSKLNCGALTLLYAFNQSARARARFQAMQAGDDHPRV
ncbi:Hypothetical protein PHPALM_18202 [Phytophthora palmivora]|uniref:Reverse transcriptase n=1 Tax=Phytophthora palmivora TaxID=4796 RepID=A0A2P4XKB5_9STRA|nr:Hypothetical protein PHPALM_18202 [Phytophthora palmivora]